MYTTSRDEYHSKRRSLVIPFSWVVSACHLVPVFGEFNVRSPFHQQDILSTGKRFFLNHYSNHFIFRLVKHWRAINAKADAVKATEVEAAKTKAAHTKAACAQQACLRLVQAQAMMERAAARK